MRKRIITDRTSIKVADVEPSVIKNIAIVKQKKNDRLTAHGLCPYCFSDLKVTISGFFCDNRKESWKCKNCGRVGGTESRKKSRLEINLSKLVKRRDSLDVRICRLQKEIRGESEKVFQRWFRELPNPYRVGGKHKLALRVVE